MNKNNDRLNPAVDSEPVVSEDKSEAHSCETQKPEATMCTVNTGKPTVSSCQTTRCKDQNHTDLKSSLTAEEPAPDNEPTELVICLQEDDFSNNFLQEAHTDKRTKMKDPVRTDQRGERAIGPLTVLTEDTLKVVKNKDMNVQHEDRPSNQTENKPTISRPKEDWGVTKEDFSFRFSSSKDRGVKSANLTSKANETAFRRLSLLKDDISNVFRISLSQEKDSKEIPSKTKVLRTDEHLKKKERGEVHIMLSEKKEELLECGFRQNRFEQNKEKLNTERINKNNDSVNQPKDREPDVIVSEEKCETGSCETKQRDETMDASDTGRPTGFFKSLFRREQNPVRASEKAEGGQQVRNRLSERKEEQQDGALWETLSEQNEDGDRADGVNQPEDSGLDLNMSEDKSETPPCETWQIKDITSTGKPRSKSDVAVEEPSQESNRRESVIGLDEDDFPNEFDREDHVDKDVTIKDHLKANHRVTRTISPLTLIKEDFLNVFRIGLSTEKGNKEDSSKVQTLNAVERQELFRRDEKLDSEKNKETFNIETMGSSTKGRMDEPDSSELDPTSETRFSETQTSEETTCTSHTVRFSAAEDAADDEKENADREHQPPESLPWESSEISLFGLRHANNNNIDAMRGQPGGDPWSPKNFATYLTFDPNTANSELYLTEGNRKATRAWSDYRPLDHPDRFLHCPQVLCREGLLDSVYWEVEWSGGADIGIAYNSISRDRDSVSCLMGHNEQSWSLECSEGSYTPCYNKMRFRSFSPEPFTHRVGVYLDWSAGTLSFYCISQDAMIHLHTFTSTFTEPLYAGFWIWAYESSVSLCQVELDWEQLR